MLGLHSSTVFYCRPGRYRYMDSVQKVRPDIYGIYQACTLLGCFKACLPSLSDYLALLATRMGRRLTLLMFLDRQFPYTHFLL